MKRFQPAVWAFLLLAVACAGALPSIPDEPDRIIAKGDAYFAREKYFQASELYKAFVERYPGNDRSDYAQYRLAQSYFADGQYELAAVEYRVVTSRYGYSEYVDDALFGIGVCLWRRAPGAERDQQMSNSALEVFEQFVQTFPTDPKVEEAREYIVRIHARLAEKAMLSVRWYFRRHRYRAAQIYCDKIIREYPDNAYWAEAVYYKGLISLRRGQREDAARFFSQVVAYPGEAPAKELAGDRLKEIRN